MHMLAHYWPQVASIFREWPKRLQHFVGMLANQSAYYGHSGSAIIFFAQFGKRIARSAPAHNQPIKERVHHLTMVNHHLDRCLFQSFPKPGAQRRLCQSAPAEEPLEPTQYRSIWAAIATKL